MEVTPIHPGRLFRCNAQSGWSASVKTAEQLTHVAWSEMIGLAENSMKYLEFLLHAVRALLGVRTVHIQVIST